MTDPLSLALGGLAGVVALTIGWLQWPRPPQLDGERWFKVVLCTLLRGRAEAQARDADAWEAEVLRFVPYHPAGRAPERKVANPVAAVLPGAALPGERALLEHLAAIDGVFERFSWMYDRDPAALDARLDDPVELGPVYDPRTALGPDATWEALAEWGGSDTHEGTFPSALAQRDRTRWVLIEGRPDRTTGPSVLAAFAEQLPDAWVVPWDDTSVAPDGAAERFDLGEHLANALTDPEMRLTLVAEEAGVWSVLRALRDHAGLRDQVAAVVSLGGVIGGRSDASEGPLSQSACHDWLTAWFAQRHLDTDVVRLTPYMAVQWLDRLAWPPGVPGQALQDARFPDPDPTGASAETVEVVDLGPLPVDPHLPLDLVARALRTVVVCWLATRR